MASVEGVTPVPTSAGIRGDGWCEPALHRQFFISSLHAAMGVYGEPAKAHGFHVFFAAYVSTI